MKKPLNSAKEVATHTTEAISKTANFVVSKVIGIGKGVFQTNIVKEATIRSLSAPGASPGIESYLKKEEAKNIPVQITTIDYGPDFHKTLNYDSVKEALAEPRREGQLVRWINIDGLNPQVVADVCQHFGIHTLAAEDVLNTFQRPKLEVFGDYLQIVVRQVHLSTDRLKNEQVSFFLFQDTLISFQEEPGDVFNPVRRRFDNPKARFRTNQADYLCYALLDSIVDHLFPLLEGYGTALEELEETICNNPSPVCQQQLFSMKRDLSLQRRALWPLREVIDHLHHDESGLIQEHLKTYFRDVQDHSMQVLDLLETYRETASSLNDLYQSSVSNKMNEIMKVLTIMASFFIPITFIAGVYGMNFENIPELHWKYSYFVFWGICISASIGLFIFFRRNGWIGKSR